MDRLPSLADPAKPPSFTLSPPPHRDLSNCVAPSTLLPESGLPRHSPIRRVPSSTATLSAERPAQRRDSTGDPDPVSVVPSRETGDGGTIVGRKNSRFVVVVGVRDYAEHDCNPVQRFKST
jgi:hypothetical protein